MQSLIFHQNWRSSISSFCLLKTLSIQQDIFNSPRLELIIGAQSIIPYMKTSHVSVLVLLQPIGVYKSKLEIGGNFLDFFTAS